MRQLMSSSCRRDTVLRANVYARTLQTRAAKPKRWRGSYVAAVRRELHACACSGSRKQLQ